MSKNNGTVITQTMECVAWYLLKAGRAETYQEALKKVVENWENYPKDGEVV